MKVTGFKLYFVSDTTTFGTMDLPLYNIPDTSKFIVKNIEGLDSPDQTILLGEGYGSSAFVQNISAKPRQIKIQLGLNPNYSAGEAPGSLRDTIYSYMSATRDRWVQFNVIGDTNEFSISGYISRIESDLFSVSSDVYITITCLSPYFQTTTQVVSYGNPVTVTQNYTVTTDATAFASFIMEFRPNQPWYQEMTISANTTPENLHIITTGGFYTSYSSDSIYLSTELGSPTFHRRNGGSPFENDRVNLVGGLTYESKFFVLPPGQSTINVDLPGPIQIMSLILLEYYWGV